jgi:hypothetical protein
MTTTITALLCCFILFVCSFASDTDSGTCMSTSTAEEIASLRAEMNALRAENQVLKAQAKGSAVPVSSPVPPKGAAGASMEELKLGDAQKQDVQVVLGALKEKAFSIVVLGASGDVRAVAL